MSVLKIFKEVTLPGVLEANAIYFVAPASKPDYVEIYVTTQDGVSRRVLNETDIQTLIDTAIAGIGPTLRVVDDITARDALNPTENVIVLVIDAVGDSTVTSGGATYVYSITSTSWKKIAETESMDLVLQWSNISGRPTSTVSEIDDAVDKAHTHTNKLVLDKLTADADGQLMYDGKHPKVQLDSNNW